MDPNHAYIINQTSCSESSEPSPGVGDRQDAPDFPDYGLKFLSDMLMEEDLDDTPVTPQDYMALQATEKSLYDAIGETYLSPSDQFQPFLGPTIESPDNDLNRNGSSYGVNVQTSSESNWMLQSQFKFSLPPENISPFSGSASSILGAETTHGKFPLVSQSRRGRKIHLRDDSDDGEGGRSNKHLAAYNEDEVQMEQFDDILLAREGEVDGSICINNVSSSANRESTTMLQPVEEAKESKGKALRGKKQSDMEGVVDWNLLLFQCAQAVASFDFRGANELLKQIRQHSSPHGNGIQRVAHYFANGLEVRMAGTTSHLYSDIISWQISASSFLKAYRSFVSAVPFKRTSFFLANQTMHKLSANTTRIHIIDFGIFCGIQWPCFIQILSERPTGPPKLRITAVDFPERGYQPSVRIEAIGRQLDRYCKRFNVPFEYHAIAQRWDTLRPEDFRIDRDEVLVVNCLCKSRALLDDTVAVDSPRDAFLNLIKRLNPALFIHGILNGTYNTPFFTTRFREALFYYSSMFDLFEMTMAREDKERQLLERELYGREILNVLASEGVKRVERPETYKQWQVRNQRAGLRQVPFDREIVSRAKAMVRANYHKDLVVDEDKNWVLQGWKGKLLFAVSCWKPA